MKEKKIKKSKSSKIELPTINQILKTIKENPRVVFNQDVYAVVGISRSTYYRHFPTDSEEYIKIQDALEDNKTNMKMVIRDRLAESKSPAALLSLYRLIATKEERDALNSYRVEELEAKNKNNTIQLKIE